MTSSISEQDVVTALRAYGHERLACAVLVAGRGLPGITTRSIADGSPASPVLACAAVETVRIAMSKAAGSMMARPWRSGGAPVSNSAAAS